MGLAWIQRRMVRAARWPSRALRRCCPRRCAAWCCGNGGIASGEDGATLIEFALVTTAMMTFVFVVMQLCVAFYSYGMICETARETTRWAALRGSGCQTAALASCTAKSTDIVAYAMGLGYPNIGGGTLNVNSTASVMFPDTYNGTANCQAATFCRVVVQITYTVPITLPLVPKNSISLATVSEMYYVQ